MDLPDHDKNFSPPDCVYETFGKPNVSYKVLSQDGSNRTGEKFEAYIGLRDENFEQVLDVKKGTLIYAQLGLLLARTYPNRWSTREYRVLVRINPFIAPDTSLSAMRRVAFDSLLAKANWTEEDAKSELFIYHESTRSPDSNRMNLNEIQEFSIDCSYQNKDTFYLGGQFHLSLGQTDLKYYTDGVFEGELILPE